MTALKTRAVETLLARAVDQLLPDVYEQAAFGAIPSDKEGNVLSFPPPRRSVRSSAVFRSLAACACLLLLCGVGAYSYFSPIAQIGIDVNPSIELKTNLYDRVIRAVPLNEDAETVLNGLQLRNVNLDTAVSAIIGSMVRHNYFQDGTGTLKITVESRSEQRVMQLEKRLIQDVKAALPADKQQVAIYTKNDVLPTQEFSPSEEGTAAPAPHNEKNESPPPQATSPAEESVASPKPHSKKNENTPPRAASTAEESAAPSKSHGKKNEGHPQSSGKKKTPASAETDDWDDDDDHLEDDSSEVQASDESEYDSDSSGEDREENES